MVWYDDRLQYYNKMMDEVENLPTTKDQDCIRLSMSQLASSVVSHAKQWESVLGKILRDSAKENLFGLRDMLDVSGCLNNVVKMTMMMITMMMNPFLREPISYLSTHEVGKIALRTLWQDSVFIVVSVQDLFQES